MDWVSVVLIAIPFFAPLIRQAGVDPVWFGVMVCVMLQTSYLTPPMAPSLFYLRAIAPKDMSGVQCPPLHRATWRPSGFDCPILDAQEARCWVSTERR